MEGAPEGWRLVKRGGLTQAWGPASAACAAAVFWSPGRSHGADDEMYAGDGSGGGSWRAGVYF